MKHLLVVLLLTGAFAHAQTHNGNWWRTLEPSNKLMYVIGYMDGDCAGEMRALMQVQPTQAQREHITKCVWPDAVTFGQVKDGLDHFYRDYRNRLIFADDALTIVKKEVEGQPTSTAEVEKLRKNAACVQSPSCFNALVESVKPQHSRP
jgi:hypothetical protein